MVLGLGISQQPSVITAEKITDNIYIVRGGIANAGFIIGAREVTAIDAGMTADSAQKTIDEIKKVTSKPLTKMILTHSDGDHVNGLSGFPKGIEIISSSGAKKEMEEAFKAPNAQALWPYRPAKPLPRGWISTSAPSGRTAPFGPAHTSGDAVVFSARKLAFVGDLVFIGRDPLIHRGKAGTSAD
jgi:glyoxylase-like metal-dependent hydrolase (beta-lactamase superfamily II)